jgi:hypothetical protein
MLRPLRPNRAKWPRRRTTKNLTRDLAKRPPRNRLKPALGAKRHSTNKISLQSKSQEFPKKVIIYHHPTRSIALDPSNQRYGHNQWWNKQFVRRDTEITEEFRRWELCSASFAALTLKTHATCVGVSSLRLCDLCVLKMPLVAANGHAKSLHFQNPVLSVLRGDDLNGTTTNAQTMP